MIYPHNFEIKIGFTEIRRLLRGECLSTLGSERVDQIAFSADADEVNEWLRQVREFRMIQETEDDFPLNYFFDVRASVARVRLENTHLEEAELFDLRRSLETIHDIVKFLQKSGSTNSVTGEAASPTYPALHRLTDDVMTFPELIRRIDQLLDKFGHLRDNASPELLPTPEQRELVCRRIRDYRAHKPLFAMDFQNDAEFVEGCIAGGKRYLHINANGDVDPCVFIHYSNANIREKTLLECLQSPLFMAYHDNMPFNDNMFRPCPMLENPEYIEKMVRETEAPSTDMQSPESVEHLVSKRKDYAAKWAPKAEEMWTERQKEKSARA